MSLHTGESRSAKRNDGFWRAASRLLAASALTTTVGIVMAMPAQAVTGATCTPVGQACDLTTPVINGSNGANADHYKDGNPGHPGQPGGDIIADFEGPQVFVSSGPLSALQALTVGGIGGIGGNGSNGSNANPFGDIFLNYRGGAGAPGQSGGAITISTGPAVSGQAVAGSFGTLIMRMALVSIGGHGGNGGVASFEFGQPGNEIAGFGGNGGVFTATIGGRWTSVQDTRLIVVATATATDKAHVILNCFSSNTGAIVQSDNASAADTPGAGDRALARAPGRRVAEATRRWTGTPDRHEQAEQADAGTLTGTHLAGSLQL